MKKATTRLCLMAMLFLCSAIAFGQVKKTVTGIVKDSTGNGVFGVSVIEKGKQSKGVVTDETGKFSIETQTGTTLIFSAVDFASQEVKVGASNSLTILLQAKQNSLSEVVITGFGESRARRNLGYSVTQVNGDQIRTANVVNPVAALQGQVPGMQVTPGVSGPSASTKFLIRGSSSLDPNGNQPLIVMDGVMMDRTAVFGNDGGQDFGNILKNLNPDDIESMSILKGGAVTALYGSKAANGVILIKTKKGVAQKGLGISLAQNMMFDQAYKTVDFQNEFGWGSYSDDWVRDANGNLSLDRDNWGLNYGPAMTGQIFTDITGKVRANNPMPDNVLSVYQTGITSNTNIALSGGNDVSTYRFSYSKLGSKAVTPNNDFDRNTFTLRATQKLGKIFSLDANITYTRSNTLNPAKQGGDAPIYQIAYSGARNYDVDYWKSHYIDSARGGRAGSDLDPTTIAGNIFFPLYENNVSQKENNFRGGLDLTAKITPWLTFNGTTTVNYYSRERETKNRGGDPGFNNPYYGSSINNLLEVRYRGQLQATRTFNDFVGTVAFGGDFLTSQAKGASYNTDGGLLPDVYRLSNSRNRAYVYEDKPNQSQLGALYFQGSLSWRDYLTLNLYGRNDKNSTLVYNDGHGKYSYYYGGADMALVFTDAFKSSMPSFLDFGKIRLSYASAGNGTVPYFTNTGGYAAGTYTPLTGSTVNTYSYGSNTLPNQDLVPERTAKIEGSLEFRVLHNRLGADITLYTQTTKSQIVSFGAPSTSGVNGTLLNGGAVRNKGIELTVYGSPIQTKNFNWTSRFIYTLNRNTIVSLPYGVLRTNLSGEDGITTIAKVGGEYGTMVAAYGYARYQAKDANGNNVNSPLNGQRVLGMFANNTQAQYIRATNYGNTPDTREPVLGSIVPKFLGSWRNTFTYKNFSLGFLLDARFGGLVYSTTYFYGSQGGSIKHTLDGRTKEHGGLTYTPVTENSQYLGFPLGTQREDGIALEGIFQSGSTARGTDGQQHDVSGLTFQEAVAKGYTTPVNAADYYVRTYSWSGGIREAGVFTSSWVSLREVTFGYDVPPSFTKKIKLNNLRATLVGRNLVFLYNSAPDHVNPDFSNSTNSGSAFEQGGIPYIRSYGFSLSTNF
ncbi:MAG: SusC/RagA family TonB-linked outer membrane protein [Agriterribacter sp.]